ncbi:DMT family transporter [Geovibrio thiophilus]|uniref:DMT family transporter n=1 Tax=Geovibrio thiophilus TaxID=139438 RepID=A0A3R5Y7Y0_9BACT|nr:DMT family transporter [Geovibrio thiophilus]QAR33861.1 DMT family transporter [Geovibrio thiophilus]
MTEKHSALLPFAAVLCAVIFWAGSFTATRIALSELPPSTIVWIRMTAGFTLLFPFCFRLFPKNITMGEIKLLAVMALLQPCLYFLLEANALRFTTASQAGVISSTVPMFVAVLSAVFLSEKTGRTAMAGLAVSVLGVAWLTFGSGGDDKAANPALGNMMELGAMVCAAGYMVLTRRLSARFNPWVLTLIQAGSGVLFFSGGASGVFDAEWSGRVTAAVIYLGVFVTIGAFGMYNWGISKIPATRAAVFINLIPVFAVFMGWGMLGESLGASQLAGSAVIAAGVLLAQKKN